MTTREKAIPVRGAQTGLTSGLQLPTNMLKIKVELWPGGNPNAVELIATANIWRTTALTEGQSLYNYGAEFRHRGKTQRLCIEHDRSEDVWELLRTALEGLQGQRTAVRCQNCQKMITRYRRCLECRRKQQVRIKAWRYARAEKRVCRECSTKLTDPDAMRCEPCRKRNNQRSNAARARRKNAPSTAGTPPMYTPGA